MSGLVQAKDYDWKDSNLAMFGSDTDKQVKKESAETEPAWEGAGQEVGLKIWRINKFEVEAVNEEEYGEFYKGDSYIVLNTYKNPDAEALLFDVHFWIGESSTQDEYGTAAYKTVELDTLLDDRAVQHREVQGHESDMFTSYFADDQFRMLTGGHATGFRHVEPVEYQPRLLRIKYTNGKPVIDEVDLLKASLKSDDVFIFDSGSQLIQLNGSSSSPMEKSRASQLFAKLKGERPNVDDTVCDEGDSDYRKCQSSLGDDEPAEQICVDDEPVEATLSKVTDADGSIGTEEVKTGGITMEDFDTNDVFLLHVNKDCFVWVGANASIDEKRNGLSHASKHLASKGKHFHHITVLSENEANNAKIAAALTA